MLLILGALTSLVVIGYRGTELPERRSAPVVKTDLKEVLKEWSANPVLSLERWKGKAVEVTGFVESIDAGKYSKAVTIATAKGGFLTPSMTVKVPDELVGRLRDYPVGSLITLQVEFTEADRFPRPLAIRIVRPVTSEAK